ncbi:MAG: toll/interleukin-1 receptor domain-containing protein [Blastocatellia bacterium]
MATGIMTRGIQAAVFILMILGGYFLGVAPPGAADSRFTVGLCGAVALGLLLFVSAMMKSGPVRKMRRYWLVASAVMLVSGAGMALVYKSACDRLLFAFPPGNIVAEQIAGTELTQAAREYLAQNPGLGAARLVDEFGGLENLEIVWTADSLRAARMRLIVSYAALILLFSAAFFSLTEVALASFPAPHENAEAPIYGENSPPDANSPWRLANDLTVPATPPAAGQESIRIFYSYDPQDETLAVQLERHLSGLQQSGLITGFNMRQIKAGEEREQQINQYLAEARIILLLVSADFIQSRYCDGFEVAHALEQHKNGRSRVIPVILRACEWRVTPLGHLQPLPANGRPVTSWPNRDEAFTDIARGIRECVVDLMKSKTSA